MNWRYIKMEIPRMVKKPERSSMNIPGSRIPRKGSKSRKRIVQERKRIRDVIELVRSESIKNDSSFDEFITFLFSLSFRELGTKSAFFAIRERILELEITEDMHALYNTMVLNLGKDDLDTLRTIISGSIIAFKDSSLDSTAHSKTRSEEWLAINGQMDDLKVKLVEEPWYLTSIVILL